jgi:hypothetical protein
MKPTAFILTIPRPRRRVRELYAADTPFRGRQERNRMVYNRRVKHRGKDQE